MKITKETIQVYKLRVENSSLWADISIDERVKSGRIVISSDYGDWQYYWGACGKPFKEFLIALNIGYVANKFGADKYFDIDKTMASLKARVEEYTDDELEKGVLLQEISELEDCSEKESFVHIISSCGNIMEMEDGHPNMVFDVHPLFNRFWNEIWFSFISELKNELITQPPSSGNDDKQV